MNTATAYFLKWLSDDSDQALRLNAKRIYLESSKDESLAISRFAVHIAQLAEFACRSDNPYASMIRTMIEDCNFDTIAKQYFPIRLESDKPKQTEFPHEESVYAHDPKFADFLLTKTHYDDLRKTRIGDFDHAIGGFVYLECLYIEDSRTWEQDDECANGRWYLPIGNWDEAHDDIRVLERRLYEYAVDEGILPRTIEKPDGFDEWSTGGGCMAYGKELENGRQILITEIGGCDLPRCNYAIGIDDEEQQQIEILQGSTQTQLRMDVAFLIAKYSQAKPIKQ